MEFFILFIFYHQAAIYDTSAKYGNLEKRLKIPCFELCGSLLFCCTVTISKIQRISVGIIESLSFQVILAGTFTGIRSFGGPFHSKIT